MFRVLVILPCLFLFAASSSPAQEAGSGLQQTSAAEDVSPPQSGGIAGQPTASLSRKGSIMFRADELEHIYASLSQVMASSPKEGSSPASATPYDSGHSSDKPLVAPAFYVSSILYYDHGNWAIWINGKRIRNGDEVDNFRVEKITGDYVDIIASQLYLDRISPNWRNKLLQVQPPGAATERKIADASQDAWDYMSADKKILVNSASGTARFRLGLHQTFVTRTMEIVEGFQKETVLVQGAETGTGGATSPSTEGKIPANSNSGDVFDSL